MLVGLRVGVSAANWSSKSSSSSPSSSSSYHSSSSASSFLMARRYFPIEGHLSYYIYSVYGYVCVCWFMMFLVSFNDVVSFCFLISLPLSPSIHDWGKENVDTLIGMMVPQWVPTYCPRFAMAVAHPNKS